MSPIDAQNAQRKKGRLIHVSIKKRNEIQQILENKYLSSKLQAHMPVVRSRGGCRYCSRRANQVFSSVTCNFCGVSVSWCRAI